MELWVLIQELRDVSTEDAAERQRCFAEVGELLRGCVATDAERAQVERRLERLEAQRPRSAAFEDELRELARLVVRFGVGSGGRAPYAQGCRTTIPPPAAFEASLRDFRPTH